MIKKIKYALLGAAALAGVLGITAAGTSDFALGKNVDMLINMFRDISFFYVDEIDPDKLMEDAAAGMTMRLDPYTEFISAKEMEQFALMTTGKYGGIGAVIREKDGYAAIAEPYEGSPADKAGLKVGDKILEINGKSAKGWTTEKVSSELKGDPGTTIKIKVEKSGTGKEEMVTIRRDRISIPAIPYYGMLGDGIGYIKHTDFSDGSGNDFRHALMELKKDGNLKGLVIDYRDNGGGIMQEAVKVLSLFVPRGTEVVSMKGRTAGMNESNKTETWPVDTELPIAVLVNRGSASATEIVSGALQDLDRAVLMGQRTFGKGLVQSTRPVGYNAYAKITTARYYIPSGRCIQAVDYAKRAEDGSVQSVPDSLVREFTTAGGRKVYDGGGVMPDVKLPAEEFSTFTILAYSKGYIEDFVDVYMKENAAEFDPGTFTLSDEIYADFTAFMKDKDMDYESATAAALKNLKEKAQKELHYDKIKGGIDALEASLRKDMEEDLRLYRGQLAPLIEDEMIQRQHYRKGVIRHGLASDREVKAAMELLADRERYDKILSSQDTERK